MALIGTWDNANVQMVLAFNAWKQGNGTVDQNSGEMPGFPDGSFDATFTNMGAGFGYDATLGICKFDGTNDFIDTTGLTPAFTNASKHTFEFKVTATVGATHILWGQNDDVNNEMFCAILNTGVLRFNFEVGGVTDMADSTETLTNGVDYTLHFVKDGTTLKIFIDGVEVTYATQDTYALGNKTYTNSVQVGARGDDTLTSDTNMFWVANYSDAIIQSRITTNSGLNNAMGLVGTNTVDVMALTSARRNRRIRLFNQMALIRQRELMKKSLINKQPSNDEPFLIGL